MHVDDVPGSRLSVRALARPAASVGVLAVAAGLVLVTVLHVLPPSSEVDPLRRTISEYALLDDGWLFDLAVALLAAGSIAVLASLVASRVLRALSSGSALVVLWSACLLVLVLFPKHNWAIGPSMHGQIHRVASLLAFLALPIGAMRISAAWREHAWWGGHASWSFWLGASTLLWFLPIIAAVTLYPMTGIPWWHAIPLGLVERLLALNAVAAVLALGLWGVRAARRERSASIHSPLLRV